MWLRSDSSAVCHRSSSAAAAHHQQQHRDAACHEARPHDDSNQWRRSTTSTSEGVRLRPSVSLAAGWCSRESLALCSTRRQSLALGQGHPQFQIRFSRERERVPSQAHAWPIDPSCPSLPVLVGLGPAAGRWLDRASLLCSCTAAASRASSAGYRGAWVRHTVILCRGVGAGGGRRSRCRCGVAGGRPTVPVGPVPGRAGDRRVTLVWKRATPPGACACRAEDARGADTYLDEMPAVPPKQCLVRIQQRCCCQLVSCALTPVLLSTANRGVFERSCRPWPRIRCRVSRRFPAMTTFWSGTT